MYVYNINTIVSQIQREEYTYRMYRYIDVLICHISLYWRFPEDGDLSLKRGGSFRFMDNL